MTKCVFHYGDGHLTAGVALEIARGVRRALITPAVAQKVERSRERIRRIVDSQQTVYGVNTGFGPLCTTRISTEDTRLLQYNLLRSHSCGVGERLPRELSKLMLILKVHALCRGFSGIKRDTVDRMIWQIENDVIPVVPSQGSVGASGDLAPLAHLCLPLIGLGRVETNAGVVEAGEFFREQGLAPIELGPKEGLALINGTQFMAASAIAAVDRLQNCLDCADIVGAMALESLLGSVKPFAAELHCLRPYAGVAHVAFRLRQLLHESQMVASHETCGRVQDPYSLRCMPQVHGASRNAWLHLKEMLEIEINSVTDNPVIVDENNAINGGNFHGQPMALPIDYAAVATSELGNISDRRTYLLLTGHQNTLPVLLMQHLGINSGFMIPQYTSAALVSENKTLCFPASADSIPTSLGQEDHVSMGAISGRKLNTMIDNLENILAVELLCAAQAFDFRRPLRSSPILDACHQLVRARIDHAVEDRVFGDDLVEARSIIQSKALVTESKSAAARFGIDLDGEHHERFAVY
jgi:histidine ammonia-lyase